MSVLIERADELVTPMDKKGERIALIRYYEVGSDIAFLLGTLLLDSAEHGVGVPFRYCPTNEDEPVDRSLWEQHMRHAADYLLSWVADDVDADDASCARAQVALEWVAKNLPHLWD